MRWTNACNNNNNTFNVDKNHSEEYSIVKHICTINVGYLIWSCQRQIGFGLFTFSNNPMFYPGVHNMVVGTIIVFIFDTKTTRLFFFF